MKKLLVLFGLGYVLVKFLRSKWVGFILLVAVSMWLAHSATPTPHPLSTPTVSICPDQAYDC